MLVIVMLSNTGNLLDFCCIELLYFLHFLYAVSFTDSFRTVSSKPLVLLARSF